MADENYGDFEEVKEEEKEGAGQAPEQGDQAPVRVRMPKGREVIGVILQRFGGNRMEVNCTDGKTRNCRVPGRYKRRLWLRPRDVVLVVPWEDNDAKGDLIFKYHGSAISRLRKKGILDSIKDEF
tara:strand:+ start:1038 stop:1412 length:375 start_codon:yes stop_codon:yes gene_type:complete